MADKESMERKVYLLPTELVSRLKSYQTQSGIASEVEVVRRLLDMALQMRDDIDSILEKLEARFEDEKDLRVLATEILTRHPLVKGVSFSDSDCSFDLTDDFSGKITRKGELYLRYPDTNYDNWANFKEVRNARLLKQKTPTPKRKEVIDWNTSVAGDVDDEIPF